MMKKNLVLFLLCMCGFAEIVAGQVSTNTRLLKQAAVDYKIAGNANYIKAVNLARQRGWALSYVSREGRKAVLVGVDNFGFPKYYITNNNTIAAATTRANQLWPGGASGLNLSGSSANIKNKIAVWDGGSVLGTHVELAGRITQKDNPSANSDHATHVTGTMIASGVNPGAKGMAYGAQGLIAYDFTNDIAEIFGEASNLLVSNHSYSIISGWSYNSSQSRWEFNGRPNDTEDYKFGYYSDDSQALDSIAYNAPFYLIVKSAGNNRDENGPAVGQPYFRPDSSGRMASAGDRPAGISSNDTYDIISWDCGAKNILTVGAVGGIASGYTRKEDIVPTTFSSWGPTDDGRIKPDVVADGVNVLSPIAASNTSYSSFSGTSMSAPNVTGSLFLLQEYYSKLKGATSFLRSATLKGLAIHTADEAGTSPGPDYQYGWGLLNVEKAAAVITAAVPSNNAATSTHLLYENTLAQGQTFTTNVIASGKGQLSATICWTDVKGTVDRVNLLNNRAKKLVNDLDIRITRVSGSPKTFLPWILDVNNPSFVAVHGDNITDNVERIDVDSTVPGQTYTITVTHKGTLARGSQAYSLLVSGVGGTAYCASASGGGGARIDSVSFKTIHQANPAGSKMYTDYTNQVADIEPSQTIPIAIKLSTADATTSPRIVKVFIDFNNNGVFDTAELVATSEVLSAAAQTYTATITTPNTLTVGNISLMRIVVQETATATDVSACGTYGKGETQDYRVRVINPANDMSVSQVVSPTNGNCGSDAQYITIAIRNNGSIDQTNIPVTASIVSGSATVANLSATFPGTVPAFTTVNYTFQTPVVIAASTTYILTAAVNLSNDQFSSNNQITTTVVTQAKPDKISGIGGICSTNAILKVSNADASNYFWYANPSTNLPFAAGPTANTSNIPADKTYYLAKEARTSIGPVDKFVFPQGGYNAFGGNYIKFTNSVPLVIETARLYIGNPGKVRINVGNIITEDANGSYSYNKLASVTLDVYATRPGPSPGAFSGNLTTDAGAVFYLNLPVIPTGDHIINLECLTRDGLAADSANGATIFRNNGITGSTTYPMSIPTIASITGNSAHTGTALESQYYYFFYDMRINTGACVSDRVAVVAATIPTPAISQLADSLVSTIGSGNQWYLNDTAIAGAITNHFKPTKSGTYKVIVTDGFGCQKTSNNISFLVTAIAPDVAAREIKLSVSPNPNNGVFNLSFEVTTKADLSIELLSAAGQKVFTRSYSGFTGKFLKQITIEPVSADFYILKIQHNKKTYVQKILIQK